MKLITVSLFFIFLIIVETADEEDRPRDRRSNSWRRLSRRQQLTSSGRDEINTSTEPQSRSYQPRESEDTESRGRRRQRREQLMSPSKTRKKYPKSVQGVADKFKQFVEVVNQNKRSSSGGKSHQPIRQPSTRLYTRPRDPRASEKQSQSQAGAETWSRKTKSKRADKMKSLSKSMSSLYQRKMAGYLWVKDWDQMKPRGSKNEAIVSLKKQLTLLTDMFLFMIQAQRSSSEDWLQGLGDLEGLIKRVLNILVKIKEANKQIQNSSKILWSKQTFAFLIKAMKAMQAEKQFLANLRLEQISHLNLEDTLTYFNRFKPKFMKVQYFAQIVPQAVKAYLLEHQSQKIKVAQLNMTSVQASSPQLGFYEGMKITGFSYQLSLIKEQLISLRNDSRLLESNINRDQSQAGLLQELQNTRTFQWMVWQLLECLGSAPKALNYIRQNRVPTNTSSRIVWGSDHTSSFDIFPEVIQDLTQKARAVKVILDQCQTYIKRFLNYLAQVRRQELRSEKSKTKPEPRSKSEDRQARFPTSPTEVQEELSSDSMNTFLSNSVAYWNPFEEEENPQSPTDYEQLGARPKKPR